MKCFRCECGQLLFFENSQCVSCGRTLGFLPGPAILSALEPTHNGLWKPLHRAGGGTLRRKCQNYEHHDVCNWMVAESEDVTLCRACRLNQTIPDLSVPENLGYWHRLELAKHRLVYSLVRLGLPLLSKFEDSARGLAFAFLRNPAPHFRESSQVVTGHAGGLVTIDLAEADDVVREKMRLEMNEPYRTLLGHFRHESGHYYWERLVHPGGLLGPFREIFGDERADYDDALTRYYSGNPPLNWQDRFVSAYCTAHPWEDWAETWAHYLHLVDTMETAQDWGLVEPSSHQGKEKGNVDAYRPAAFDALMEGWIPLTMAINSINRSMGLRDLYPFVLSEVVKQKLAFVHRVIGETRDAATADF